MSRQKAIEELPPVGATEGVAWMRAEKKQEKPKRHAADMLWLLGPLAAVVAGALLVWLGAPRLTVLTPIIPGALLGALMQGITAEEPDPDYPGQTKTVRARPMWARYTTLGFTVALAAVCTWLMISAPTSPATMAGGFEFGKIGSVALDWLRGPVPTGLTWGVFALVWLLGLGLAGWMVWRGLVERRTVRASEPKTMADRIALRLTEGELGRAGLSVKVALPGQASATVPPQIHSRGVDSLGNPYVVARLHRAHQTLDDFKSKAERIASAWDVEKVVVSREVATDEHGITRHDLVRLTVSLHTFTFSEPVPWRTSLVDPQTAPLAEYLGSLPMGVMVPRVGEEVPDAGLAPWTLSLVQINAVVGGLPGSGKGGFLKDLFAHLAAHPHIDISAIDLGKGGAEFAKWAPRFAAVAGTPRQAADLIRYFRADSKKRYARMQAYGTDNAWLPVTLPDGTKLPPFLGNAIDPETGKPERVKILVVDEAAQLLRPSSKKDQQALIDESTYNLTSIIETARAAGYIVIFATQRPSAMSIPTAIRDNCARRLGFSLASFFAAEVTLGEEWKSARMGDEHIDPISIDIDSQKGMAVAFDDATKTFVRVQTAWVPDPQIHQIVTATAGYRIEWPYRDPAVQAQAAAIIAADDEDQEDEEIGLAATGDTPTTGTRSPLHLVKDDDPDQDKQTPGEEGLTGWEF